LIDPLLTVEDVARIVGVKPSTVKTWVHERSIPFIKIGAGKRSPVRFNPESIQRWLEDQESSPGPGDGLKESMTGKKFKKARGRTVEKFLLSMNNPPGG